MMTPFYPIYPELAKINLCRNNGFAECLLCYGHKALQDINLRRRSAFRDTAIDTFAHHILAVFQQDFEHEQKTFDLVVLATLENGGAARLGRVIVRDAAQTIRAAAKSWP